ncbi:C1 family peptidase [Aeoliella sp.]|uniref:C1 family peptidase n=1 Tax=Aeoliella sp. TaxID=2795800 RepID=UPI003CCBA98D
MSRVCIPLALLALLVGVPTTSAEQLPASVDLRSQFESFGLECWHQGERNTCSLFAITACANYAWLTAGETTSPSLSEEFLVWAANEATGRRGDQAMFYEAVQGLNELGIPSESSCSYHRTGETSRPAESTIAEAQQTSGRWRPHWIKLWSLQSGLSEEQFTSIKQTLAAGRPVACGLRWPRSKKPEDLLKVPTAAEVRDGHSIVFVGYQDDDHTPGGGYLVFRNSYGPKWQEAGYGRMAYDYARQYGNDALWIELGAAGSERPSVRIEAESLELVEENRCHAFSFSMRRFGQGMWSEGRQLFASAEADATAEWKFQVAQPGVYRARFTTTAGPRYGIIQAQLNDHAPTEPMDLYAGKVSPGASLELGVHRLEAGEHRVRVTVLGKNELARNYNFGLDTFDLLPAEEQAPSVSQRSSTTGERSL